MTSANPPEQTASAAADPSWIKRVPVITGVLAALAGFLTVRSAALSNEAIYFSNQGVLHQAKASDKWTEYQADSIKKHIVDTAMRSAASLAATQQSALEAEREDFASRQNRLSDEANGEERARESMLAFGQNRLGEKDILAYAGMSAQLGIALASVAALTRRYPAFAVSLVLGLGGILITGYAYLLHFTH